MEIKRTNLGERLVTETRVWRFQWNEHGTREEQEEQALADKKDMHEHSSSTSSVYLSIGPPAVGNTKPKNIVSSEEQRFIGNSSK